MKTSVNIFRIVLLQLFFTVFCFLAMAHVPGHALEADAKSKLFQDIKIVSDLKEGIVTNPSFNKYRFAPTLILTIVPYQGQIARLSWTTTEPATAGTYYVERQVKPSVSWDILKQIPYDSVLSYNDTISFPYCSVTNFSYRIRFVSVSGLDTSLSGTEDVPLSDLNSPADVQNLCIDITQSRFPELTWTPVSGDDILGYRIQRYNGYSWDSITTVADSVSSYIDKSVLGVCDKSYRYVVSTIDKCGISSAPVYTKQFVHTLLIEPLPPGQCDNFSKITWNSYNAMPGGLGGYKLYRNDGSTSVELTDTQDTTYFDSYNFINGLTYFYSVEAYSKNGVNTSSSCMVGWTYSGTIVPDTVYITRVSVEDDTYISVGYYSSPAGSVNSLILERSDDNGVTYQAIDSLAAPVPQQFSINDTTAEVHAQAYFYRLAAIDDCGNKTFSMNFSKSIWLQCTPTPTQNTLDWNTYESWLQGVKGYEIFRVLNGEAATIKSLGVVDSATVSFSDLLTSYDPAKMPCYWVEATENPGNHYLQNAISKSNTCCIIKDAVLYMPNAFYPEGINRLFRPVPSPIYVDNQSFKMTIFNRWGQQLYETTDMNNGWDGKIKGQFSPAGQYPYLITYKSMEGKEYTIRGTVLLIR